MADRDLKLDRIESKIDDISDHLASVDVTLKGQHITLKEHMRRTELLEKDLAPIKKHVYMIQGAIAFITILATAIGIWQAFK